MSDAMNSHATAIKQAARDLAQGNIWATDRHIETIDHHADALATELDEANARVKRLRRLHAADVVIRAYCPDVRIPAVVAIEYSDAQRACVQHGDLDGAPGDTAGELP